MTVTLNPALPAADAGVVADRRQADPEVPEHGRRRAFTSRYKLEILAAYDAAEPGEKGALLRREGLYSSHIVEWRRPATPGRSSAWLSRATASARICGTRRSPPWSGKGTS